MKIDLPYVKRQLRRRANGRSGEPWARTYWYYRRKGAPDDGARLPGEPRSPEFMATYNEYQRRAENKPTEPRPDSFAALVAKFRASPEFTGLSEKSARDYSKILDRLVTKFGPLPYAGIDTEVVFAIRDSMKNTPAMANYVLRVLRRLLSWAVERKLIQTNPAANPKQLKVKPRDAHWSDEAEAAFLKGASVPLALAYRLAIFTAQRQADILAMTWTRYSEGRITVRQQKTGALLDIPCHEELRSILDALPRVSTHILTDVNDRPFLGDNFRHQWREATLAAGLDGLQFRDLRRTAMIRLAEAGCTDIEIAAVSGHEIDQTRKILETYVPRTSAMASSAIAKLEAHRPKKDCQSGKSGKHISMEVGNTKR